MVNHALYSILFAWFLSALALRTDAITDPMDVQALMQVKAAINPSSIRIGSCVSTWNFSVDPCDNLFGPEYFSCGISCELVGEGTGIQRITSVKLESSGYGGTLAPAIGNLSFLQYLQLGGNAFEGVIPASIGQLHALVVLDISGNSFSGSLPDTLQGLQSLGVLNANDNSLSGMLPSNMNSLINLIECRLQNNMLSGPIPDLSSLEQLRVLDLANNNFSGSVPTRFAPSLISASFGSNSLTGGLTKQNVDAINSVLIVLDLNANQLSGPIDISLFQHPSLQQINLSNNSFSMILNGDRPASVNMAQSQMVAIDLSNNKIEGNLPGLFAEMPKLSSLSLSNNAFTGQIHESYALKALAGMAGLLPLQRLMLDDNYLIGPLPALFMKLLPENIMASFVDNCLSTCPPEIFFCQGGDQKPNNICRFYG
ncbi:hypothetical protein KP509_13G009900 [Ceratopteris richardii]|nr:hypothetical protein KP509_13G009900 [Ceratopteris richardii]